jgi:hypothetical protein
MLRILIVLIIAAIIWMLDPLTNSFKFKPPTHVDKKTQREVNQVINQTQQQVNYARQIQKQESGNMNNP